MAELSRLHLVVSSFLLMVEMLKKMSVSTTSFQQASRNQVKKNENKANKITNEDDFWLRVDRVNSQNNVQLVRVYRLKAIMSPVYI